MESSPDVSALPVAPYIAGKSLLAKRIIKRIEAIPHTCYAEPFIGMGGIFLRRPQPAKVEVINDLSRDVWCLFRVLQDHYPYFTDFLRFRMASRAEFERLQRVDPDTLTDIQRVNPPFLSLRSPTAGGALFVSATDQLWR